MDSIRKATTNDAGRIAEIEIFNFRLYFYPIFKNDKFYFEYRQVIPEEREYRESPESLDGIYVYDDGVVKGFADIDGAELKRLFVEPVLHGNGIGDKLLDFAAREKGVRFLWALEKNTRAIAFYERHGFHLTGDKKYEEGTTEYLVRLEKE